MAVHEHGTPSSIFDLGEDGYCQYCRPDAAPPKEVPSDIWLNVSVMNDGELWDLCREFYGNDVASCAAGFRAAAAELSVAPPPPDAAPVAWRWRRTDVDFDRWLYWHPESDPPHHDPRRFIGKRDDIEVQPVYAHPEDAPCEACNGQGFTMEGTLGGYYETPCPDCTTDAHPEVTAIRKGLYQRLINTGRFTGADRGIVMDFFDLAALAAAQKEGE